MCVFIIKRLSSLKIHTFLLVWFIIVLFLVFDDWWKNRGHMSLMIMGYIVYACSMFRERYIDFVNCLPIHIWFESTFRAASVLSFFVFQLIYNVCMHTFLKEILSWHPNNMRVSVFIRIVYEFFPHLFFCTRRLIFWFWSISVYLSLLPGLLLNFTGSARFASTSVRSPTRIRRLFDWPSSTTVRLSLACQFDRFYLFIFPLDESDGL